jgi:predicted nuclease of predicted toxin-antitoxin system
MKIWHRFCTHEGRILLTLDLDFSDIRAYLPEEFPGILVLRSDKTGILYSRLTVEYYRF